ncbi:GTP cyclohydrolase 1 [Rickettsiales bacterium]|nr:GTP cyclohydrolase 1 [Rickettsiales bacterium]
MAVLKIDNKLKTKPSRLEAENAVKTLISWAGDDPYRKGLLETPRRVLDYYLEAFSGYDIEPEMLLKQASYEADGYDEMIVLRDIGFESCCEHHVLPIIGKVSVAYIPAGRIVGISKIARLVDAYARRLQIQERLTAQIAETIYRVLKPRGVGVLINATHHCMSYRGTRKKETIMRTSCMLGVFREDTKVREEFLNSN